MSSHRGSLLPPFVRNIFRPKHQANEIEPRGIDLANRKTLLECQKSSKFAQLPEDILMLFSLQLDKTAKARFVQTCRYLRHLLELTLYVHLGPLSSWRPDQSKPLHRTLAERPDLIQYIRSYKGPVIPPSVRSYTRPPPKRTLQNMFRVRKTVESVSPPNLPIPETEGFKIAVFIFTRATQIVDLGLVDSMDWSSDPIFEPIKAAVSEMSLNRLYLWGCAKPVQVLQTQPELEHLEVGWNVGSVEGLDKFDIPKLKSLTSMLEGASYIVPGRPVEQLILTPKGPLDTALFSCLALSTGPIIKLSMWAYDHWRIRNGLWFAQNGQRPLQIASQNLRNLEQLTIDVNGRIPIQLILNEIPSFQSLRRLVILNVEIDTNAETAHSSSDHITDLSAGDDGTPYYPIVNDWDDLFRRLKILCPLLVEVDGTPW